MSSRVTVPRLFLPVRAGRGAARCCCRRNAGLPAPPTGWRAIASSPQTRDERLVIARSPRPAVRTALRRPHLSSGARGRRVRDRLPDRPVAGARHAPLAAAAEAHGFDVVSVFADLLYQPPLQPRSPGPPAGFASALACLNLPTPCTPVQRSPGRSRRSMPPPRAGAYLGLGPWQATRAGAIGRTSRGVPAAATVARGRRCAPAPCWPSDEAGFAGQEFRLEPGTRLRAPRSPSRVPPLLLGAWGPWRPPFGQDEIAGMNSRWAAPFSARRSLRRPNSRVTAASLAAGRAAERVRVVAGAVTVVAEDGAAARWASPVRGGHVPRAGRRRARHHGQASADVGSSSSAARTRGDRE